MNKAEEQLWVDIISGMQNKAMIINRDDDSDNRNRNWYARKVYGDRYDTIRGEFQKRAMNELSNGEDVL